MTPVRLYAITVWLTAAVFLLPNPMWCDDSAAAIAAGGLVSRRETRVVMAKEVLQISPTKVVVDYDFRNDSDQDVTTEVAFPIPPYVEDWMEQDPKAQSFADFKLWVNGKPVRYSAEARAIYKGSDVTAILTADKVDIASFGHFEELSGPVASLRMPDYDRLSKIEQHRLNSLGIIGLDSDVPSANWTVRLQYHWTQSFPAHSSIHIRHEYTPVVGFQFIQLEAFRKALAGKVAARPIPLFKDRDVDDLGALTSFCPDPAFLQGMIHAVQQEPADSAGYASPEWVDFILTSANTWKQPIEDFTLIVERGKPLDGYGKPFEGRRRVISFCSPQNAEVKRLDADRFQVHLTNFVPQSELHIGFFDFDVPSTVTKTQAVKK